MKHVKAGPATKALGLSRTQLRTMAERRQLPEGSVIATPGGHFLYDIESIRTQMLQNYLDQTRFSAQVGG